jgi:outer membrane protein assembly factor BamB
MIARTRIALVVATVATASLSIQAQRSGPTDWIQWRGPNRDGVASTFTPPAVWPEALVQKWRIEVGTGYASPIVVGNRVYAFSRRGTNEGMSAHDATTGRELWRFGYDAPFTMHSAATRHNEGPKSTPIYTNGKLLSIGMTGVITAWDAESGRVLWRKPASQPVPLYTSHAFSPLVDGDTVIFHVGGHDKGALTKFDIATGNQIWAWTGDGPGYGSPIVATIGGTKQVVTLTQMKVVGVDFATGALLWERPLVTPSTNNSNTPILYGETIIVSSNGGPTVAFRATRSGTTWTTANVWENAEIPLRLTNLVLTGDMLFGITNRNAGQYFAVDAKTGKTLWVSPGRQAGSGAIARAGNYLLCLEDDGELVVVKNDPAAFELVKKYKVAEGDTWAEAVYSGNRIFIKDLNHLTLWTLN